MTEKSTAVNDEEKRISIEQYNTEIEAVLEEIIREKLSAMKKLLQK